MTRLRRGLSLLEVLISLFIIAIGLLGVATLIPAGRLQLMKVNESDRTGACGRAGIRDVKVRRMLDYTTVWQASHPCSLGVVVYNSSNGRFYRCTQAGITDSNAPTWPEDGTNVNDNGVVWQDLGSITSPIAIDPLGTAYGLGMNLGGTRTLPNAPQGYASFFPLPRYSLDWGWNTTLVDRVFRWSDELTLDYSRDARPRAIVQDSTTPAPIIGPYPPQGSEPAMTLPVQPMNEGNFSWFVTASPTQQANVAEVSVVVCNKRLFSLDNNGQPTSERVVDVNAPNDLGGGIYGGGFFGNGLGGGTIELKPQITVNGTQVNINSQNFPLKSGQWVMLCGWTPYDPGDGNFVRMPTLCRWYRVISVNTAVSPPYVTLNGPDWPVQYQTAPDPAYGFSTDTPAMTTLVVVDGVTGVYTRTIRLDQDAIWRK